MNFSNVSVAVETVTPQLANLYLRSNPNNRSQRLETVNIYAREIENGRFLLSDSAICFDTAGNLINGQHRLESCVKANKPITVIVARNMPPECILVMDQPLVRRVHDLLKIAGVTDADNKLGTLINAMNMPGSDRRGNRMTSQEAAEFVLTHSEAIQFVATHCAGNRKKGIGRANLRAAIARAWYHCDRDRLAEFARLMTSTEVSMEPGNEAVYLLKDYLTTMTGKDTDKKVIHGKCERALKAFVDREPIKKLYESKTELFPLPGEFTNGRRVPFWSTAGKSGQDAERELAAA